MNSAEAMLDNIRVAGLEVNPEDEAEVYLWEKGKALRHLTSTYGWDVLKEMLSSYQTDAIESLFNKTDETDKDRVFAAFARAKAANVLISALYADIDNAIKASEQLPGVIKSNVKKLRSQVPPESL